MGVSSKSGPGPTKAWHWWLSNWVAVSTGVGVALRSLLANKFRASLTALGIIIGVMTVTGILSIIQGLNQGVSTQLSLMGARSLYLTRWPWVSRGHHSRYRHRPPITDWQYQRLRELAPFAEAMALREHRNASVAFGGEKITDVDILGTTSEFSRISGYSIERGRFLTPADVSHDRPFVVLGAEVADTLFGQSEPLGKKVVIRGLRYQVIGVLKAQGSFLGNSLDVNATMPLGRFRQAFGYRHGMDIALKVVAGLDMDATEDELKGIMRRVRGLRPAEVDDFSINRQKAFEEVYRDITGTLFLVIVLVGMISLAVGGIGIMNIMLVSVTERTREIGVRKAMGAKRRTILFQFMVESLVLSGLGGVIGLGAGFLVAYVVEAISPLPAQVSVTAIVAGLGFSTAVGMFFGIYPAWRASQLDPIAALRYD